jgi:hypothetical protein
MGDASPVHSAESGPPSSSHPAPTELFERVWRLLSEVIGTAATASVLRRSIRCAQVRGANLDGLEVVRDGFNHRYSLPSSWSHGGDTPMDALRVLADELSSILYALTGPVLVRRLASDAELRRARIFTPPEES